MAEFGSHYPSPLVRYFSTSSRIPITGEPGNFLIFTHLTGLAMICLEWLKDEEIISAELLVKPDKKKKFIVNEGGELVKLVLSSRESGDSSDHSTSITLRSPISGEVQDFNPLLKEHPELVQSDPTGRGHLLFITPRKSGGKRKFEP